MARDESLDEPAGDVLTIPEIEKNSIQSIERAADVLSLFDRHTRSLTPALVAERLGLNRTTAHRYLQSLQGSGFLDANNGLGPLFDQLAPLISGRQQVLQLAPAVMRQLSDRTGLTVVLSFLGRDGAVVTLVEEASTGTIILTVRVGTVLELRAAQSRVLLAFQNDPGVVQRFHASLTPAEARQESLELARVRRERIAWADLGRVGLSSAAAPVFGPHDIQAAMGILGTSAVLPSHDSKGENARLLREAAEKLSGLLSP